MKKISSMIALVAVFGSANVMADCAGDLDSMGLNSSMRGDTIKQFCQYSELSGIVALAKKNGTKLIFKPAYTTESLHTHSSSNPIKTFIHVGKTTEDGMCGGSTKKIKLHYAVMHELYHAAHPGVQSDANEAAAILNTNKLRSKRGDIQRSQYKGKDMPGVCNQ